MSGFDRQYRKSSAEHRKPGWVNPPPNLDSSVFHDPACTAGPYFGTERAVAWFQVLSVDPAGQTALRASI